MLEAVPVEVAVRAPVFEAEALTVAVGDEVLVVAGVPVPPPLLLAVALPVGVAAADDEPENTAVPVPPPLREEVPVAVPEKEAAPVAPPLRVAVGLADAVAEAVEAGTVKYMATFEARTKYSFPGCDTVTLHKPEAAKVRYVWSVAHTEGVADASYTTGRPLEALQYSVGLEPTAYALAMRHPAAHW